jgi:hypothetical protein
MNETHPVAVAFGVIVAVLLASAIIVTPVILYVLTLQRTLRRCSPENRAVRAGLVWLMLVPLFNVFWHFIVVSNLAKSVGAEFRKRGVQEEAKPGLKVGLAMCVLGCCWFIPFVNIPASLGALVCWILYWWRIADCCHRLAAPPVIVPVPDPQREDVG